MKIIKLEKRDVYDLASVISAIVKEQSEKLDFKEVLHLQKSAIYMLSEIKDFSDKFEDLAKEKNVYVKNANEKISAYKEKLNKDSDKSGEVDSNYKEKIDEFVQMVLEEAQAEIDKLIAPQYEELYKAFGIDTVELSFGEDPYNMIVINFEKYAKEKYTNKSRMVEVYEALISADSK